MPAQAVSPPRLPPPWPAPPPAHPTTFSCGTWRRQAAGPVMSGCAFSGTGSAWPYGRWTTPPAARPNCRQHDRDGRGDIQHDCQRAQYMCPCSGMHKFGSLLEYLLMHECLVAVCCPGALKRRWDGADANLAQADGHTATKNVGGPLASRRALVVSGQARASYVTPADSAPFAIGEFAVVERHRTVSCGYLFVRCYLGGLACAHCHSPGSSRPVVAGEPGHHDLLARLEGDRGWWRALFFSAWRWMKRVHGWAMLLWFYSARHFRHANLICGRRPGARLAGDQ